MDDNSQRAKKQVRRATVLEGLKEVSDETVKTFRQDVLKAGSKDFVSQLFGSKFVRPKQHFSGELLPGDNLEINEVYSGERGKREKLEQQLSFERRLRDEEQALVEKKTNELKLQLHALMQELSALSMATPKLAREVEIATLQAPVNPGIYHVIFFEKLLEFIKSFRTKVEDATVWLHSVNKRAQKKNFWNSYKKHGGKRLLSSEDYSQRSAG